MKAGVGAAVLIATLMTTAPAASVDGSRLRAAESGPSGAKLDRERDCFEPVPEAASVASVTDDGSDVALDLLVILDDVSRRRGRDVIRTAGRAYAPLSITLEPRFRKVSFRDDGYHTPADGGQPVPTADERRLFREMIALVGGRRPPGTDAVLLLTSKDIFWIEDGERQYSSAGVAYCIGGVRFPEKAFAISETWRTFEDDPDYPGKVAAHELGHLMGAHHHYANCVEGERNQARGVLSVCTVMEGTLVRFFSLKFGTLESLVIRGHAVDFASRDAEGGT